MHILHSVLIEGLWGSKTAPINIQLDPKINFLIGQNGTGKTTGINLIPAARLVDFERLDKIQFTKVKLTLKEGSSRKRPTIKITKKPKEAYTSLK